MWNCSALAVSEMLCIFTQHNYSAKKKCGTGTIFYKNKENVKTSLRGNTIQQHHFVKLFFLLKDGTAIQGQLPPKYKGLCGL
jgi:hypothetical protein